jgi:hypothetical protein
MDNWFLGLVSGAGLTGLLLLVFLSGTTPIKDKEWACTAQVIVNNTYPSEYECIQYTIKDKEIKKLTKGVRV